MAEFRRLEMLTAKKDSFLLVADSRNRTSLIVTPAMQHLRAVIAETRPVLVIIDNKGQTIDADELNRLSQRAPSTSSGKSPMNTGRLSLSCRIRRKLASTTQAAAAVQQPGFSPRGDKSI